MSHVIRVQGISKQFRRFHADRPTTLQEAITRGLRKLKPVEFFWALHDITFNVSKGHMLGVIGPNGAGKSTLLRLIGGVGRPDEGTIQVQGRIGGLLDLGAGFHPDLTGRENVYVNGVISGLTRQEVDRRFDQIIEFSELQEAIDAPLRTYSTGMQMRLGFAVAVHTDPEILLIDEVLAVGDVTFRAKCLERINQFKEEGRTIVFVSHDTNQIQNFCDEALWLRTGQIMAYGETEDVIERYLTEMNARAHGSPQETKTTSVSKSGLARRDIETFDLKITAVRLVDQQGRSVEELASSGPLRVELEYLTSRPITSPIFDVSIYSETQELCCHTNSDIHDLTLPTVQGRGCLTLHFERLDLVGGDYFFSVGAYTPAWDYTFDYQAYACKLHVRPTPGFQKGIIRPPHHWEISDEQPHSPDSKQAHDTGRREVSATANGR